MFITTLSSRQFNQDASRAKEAVHAGPVFITDRGRPAHVLLTFSDHQKMSALSTKIADLLAMTGCEDIAFDALPSRELAQAASLS